MKSAINSEEDILLHMARIMEEFANSEESYILELGHYLADNLIMKISLYLVEKKENKKINRSDFPAMYTNLKRHYPNIPDYENKIKHLHADRNIFAHDSDSTRLQIRRERAIEYCEIVKEIMLSTGLISIKKQIYETEYLDSRDIFLHGSQLKTNQWNKLIEVLNDLYDIWVNKIDNSDWKIDQCPNDIDKTMYYSRGITKFSTKLECYKYYDIAEIKKSFDDVVDDLRILAAYNQKLLLNDGDRIHTLYHQRIESSDHKFIKRGLYHINSMISDGKDRFDFESLFDWALPFIGIGISLFIGKFIRYLYPQLNEEEKWFTRLNFNLKD